jgi:hypothetical protein
LGSANLRNANLRNADLSNADLSDANLGSADLRSADLRFANLRFANLRFAKNWIDTEWANQCKQNILFILSYLPSEIQRLKDRIIAGQIDGTQYAGECCCLIGTLGNDKICPIIPFYKKGLHNLGEQLFYQIRKGDTPENNEFSKLAIELCDMALKKIK